ncbi:hypothetical protein D3C81_2029950 [compost metagenome]
MADAVAVALAEVIDAALEVVEHVRVDHWRERADHRPFDAPWLLGESDQGRGAAPGERQHVFGGEVVNQLEQNLPFDVLGQMFLVAVVGF